MPEVRELLKNVYFDTAASPFLYKPDIYLHVSRIIGADRILLGSDYPLMPPSRLLKEIDSIELPEESRNDILSSPSYPCQEKPATACRYHFLDKKK